MEVESAKDAKSIGARPENARNRRRSICLAVIAVVLAIVILLLVIGFTVFKAKHPITTVNSTAVKDFKFSLDMMRLRVNLNVSLDINLSVKNPNKVGFKYTNSSTMLKYRGEVVGDVPVPAGEISAGETVVMNLTVTVLADRLLSNSDLYSDVISGTLPFSTFSRVSGKVRILSFNIHLVSYTTCDLNISVANRSIANQNCQYKTKL